jgi:cysteine-rich repeat protein
MPADLTTWHPTTLSYPVLPTPLRRRAQGRNRTVRRRQPQPFDGCTPTCTNEPKCGYTNNDTSQPYACFSVCGDGIKMPDEACDDGNVQNGDGCSSTCTIEPGYTCDAPAGALGDSLALPILYRDFNWKHPQFEVAPAYDRRQPGIVKQRHRANGKPVYNTAYVGMDNAGALLTRATTMDGPAMNTAASTSNTTLMSDATGHLLHEERQQPGIARYRGYRDLLCAVVHRRSQCHRQRRGGCSEFLWLPASPFRTR